VAKRSLSLKNIEKKVRAFVSTIPLNKIQEYSSYFNSILPTTDEAFFKRWLFAWSSIQTTWEKNCALYDNIKDLSWFNSKQDLKDRIVASKAGLTNLRTTYMWNFKELFWNNPEFYRNTGDRSWVAYRKDLVDNILGMGFTKCAFVCEMAFPQQSEVVCLDTHMLKLLGHDVNNSRIVYNRYVELENIWVTVCKEFNVPPAIGRAICWDQLQGKEHPEYWCYVFQDENIVKSA